MALGLVLLLLILVGLSLWLRIIHYRTAVENIETRSSPLSAAVQELVATAGGIYLAVIALTSFLKLEMPEKVDFLQVSLDPLALGSISIAIIQPLITRVINKFIK